MRTSAQRRVQGGKQVRVYLEIEGGTVTAAEVSGDFFIYPEEGLKALEDSLVGLSASTTEDSVLVLVEDIFGSHGITTLGFGPRDLARTIWEAFR